MSAGFKFQPFSKKQKKLITWWMPQSPHSDKDMIIADGAIRSGKTVAMINGFIDWSLETFNGQNFILAGKSKGALTRNVINPMKKMLAAKGIPFNHIRTTEEPRIEIGANKYYLFGANDKSAKDSLQGLTAAGAYCDEVALFPENFVDETIGRCSVEGSKHWWNANPQGPYHHIKTEYIDKAEQKNILRLQFNLDDNLTLSDKIKQRYEKMFDGVFYQRNILGMWVIAEGIIYDNFDEEIHVVNELPEHFEEVSIGVDYGDQNPTVFLLLGKRKGELYLIDEYYHGNRESGRIKDIDEYIEDFAEFTNKYDCRINNIIIDPAAKTFINLLKRDSRIKAKIKNAKNDVVPGIRTVSTRLSKEQLFVHNRCKSTKKEFSAYAWDETAQKRGEDKPIKENDHAMDALRYIIYTLYPIRGSENRVKKKPAGF